MSGNKIKKVKGTVLYTVISVMSILTVLVFAAMTLAASAHRRSYNNYANNQTQYTARSVIDLVWYTIMTSEDLKKALPTATEMYINDLDTLSMGMGEIVDNKVTITNLGNSNYKLQITVKLLGQDNTFAAYYSAEVKRRPDYRYGIRTIANTSIDAVKAYGGISLSVEPRKDYLIGYSQLTNNCESDSPIHLNGNLDVATKNGLNLLTNEGLFVCGNIYFNNNTGANNPSSFVTYDKKLKYRDLPYIHTYREHTGARKGGYIYFDGGEVVNGTPDTPVLVFARALCPEKKYYANEAEKRNELGAAWTDYEMSYPLYYDKEAAIFGDLYLYGEYDTSYLGGKTSVIPWNDYENHDDDILEKNIAKTDISYTGGNIYSLGTINYEFSKGGYSENLANNVVAKNLNLSGASSKKVSITGAAVIGDSMNIDVSDYDGSNTYECSFPKGLFVRDSNFNYNDNKRIKINNVLYGKRGHWEDEYYEELAGSVTLTLPLKGENQRWNLSNKTIWDFPSGSNKNFPKDVNGVEIDYTKIEGYEEGMVVRPQSININRQDKDNIYDNFNIEYLNLKVNMSGKKISDGSEPESYIGYSTNDYWKNVNGYNLPFSDGRMTFYIYNSDSLTDYTNNKITFELLDGRMTWGMFTDIPRQITVESVDVTLNFFRPKVKKIYVYSPEDDVPYETDLSYLKEVNDYAFDLNNDEIIIDDIDKSVKLTRSADKSTYSISVADLDDIEGNEGEAKYSDPAYYNAGNYAAFIDAVIKAVKYPESMDVVVINPDSGGNKANDGVVLKCLKSGVNYGEKGKNCFIDDSQLYGEGDLEIKDDEGKTIGHKPGESYIRTNSKINVTKMFSKANLKKAEKAYDGSGTITKSCTLSGNITSPIDIITQPGEDPGDLYIILDNVTVSADITIDDSFHRVNFLIPKDSDLKVHAKIMTKYYREEYEKTLSDTDYGMQIPRNPIIKEITTDSSGNEYTIEKIDDFRIPDVYFYMYYDEDVFEKDKAACIFEIDGGLITGYIEAPSGECSFSTNKTGISTNVEYFMDKVHAIEGKSGLQGTKRPVFNVPKNLLVGGSIFKSGKNSTIQNNAICFAYVNPNPTGNQNVSLGTTPELSYYQAF